MNLMLGLPEEEGRSDAGPMGRNLMLPATRFARLPAVRHAGAAERDHARRLRGRGGGVGVKKRGQLDLGLLGRSLPASASAATFTGDAAAAAPVG